MQPRLRVTSNFSVAALDLVSLDNEGLMRCRNDGSTKLPNRTFCGLDRPANLTPRQFHFPKPAARPSTGVFAAAAMGPTSVYNERRLHYRMMDNENPYKNSSLLVSIE
jgi:hypothetical protein